MGSSVSGREDGGFKILSGSASNGSIGATSLGSTTKWWSSCKEYINEERRRKGSDETIFGEFQDIVDRFYDIEMKRRRKTRTELGPGNGENEISLKEEKDL